MGESRAGKFEEPKKGDFDEKKLLSRGQEKMKIDAIRYQEKGRRPIDSVDELISFVFTPGWEW